MGKAPDTVVLKLNGAVPEKSFLWYGYGLDPYCNLTDEADMAVPVFGPIALDEVPDIGRKRRPRWPRAGGTGSRPRARNPRKPEAWP